MFARREAIHWPNPIYVGKLKSIPGLDDRGLMSPLLFWLTNRMCLETVTFRDYC